jgi:uncharacterized delta-60 repeat protein
MRRSLFLCLLGASGALSAANSDGALDAEFGDGGRSVFGFLESENVQMRAIAKFPASGRVWMFGDAEDDPQALFMARTFANGGADTGFGSNNDGQQRTLVPATLIAQSEFVDIAGALMQVDGKPIVFGGLRSRHGESGAFPALVCRLNAAGGLDSGFSGDGCQTLRSFAHPAENCRASDAAITPDNSIVVIGNCVAETMTETPFVARLLDNGQLDLEFGAGAGLITPAPPTASTYAQHYSATVVRPDGYIAVLGHFEMASNNLFDLELGILQFDNGGSIDSAFSGDGVQVFAFDLGGDNHERARDLALRPDGKLLALGEAKLPNPQRTVALLAQTNANGSMDNSFDGDGRRVDAFDGTLGADAAFASIDVDPLGRAIAAGTTDARPASAMNHSGTDFWIVFPFAVPPETAPRLRIASDVVTSGVVTNAAFGVNLPFAVGAGGITELILPVEMMYYTDSNGLITERGVHVTTQAPVSVLVKSGRGFSVDTTAAIPTPALGSHYRIMSWGPSIGVGSGLAVVASENNTKVTFNLKAAAGGHAAGIPFSVTLDQGETYALWADVDDADLSGSTVISDHPVAVTSGNSCALVPNPTIEFCDQATEQQRDVSDWGTQFYSVPTLGRGDNGDMIRILAHESDTSIWLDDTHVAVIGAGQTHDMLRTSASRITTSKPASAALFAIGCKGTDDLENCPGDPFMMELVPTSRWQMRYDVNIPDKTLVGPQSYQHHIVIVAPSEAVDGVSIDGVVVPAATFAAIGNSGFAQAQVATSTGIHVVQASHPVAVNAYGFSASEAYGHAAAPAPLADATLVNSDDVIARYALAGARDLQFGNGGSVVFSHESYFSTTLASHDRPVRAFADGDGIVVGSATRNGASEQHLLLGYRIASGSLFKDSFE